MSNDPLLQPFKLKHLTLRNRLMTSSHEPAYPDDGMPKGRYRAYHVERAKAGLALTMTAGDEYLPVPTKRRDEKDLPAMMKLSMMMTRPSCLP